MNLPALPVGMATTFEHYELSARGAGAGYGAAAPTARRPSIESIAGRNIIIVIDAIAPYYRTSRGGNKQKLEIIGRRAPCAGDDSRGMANNDRHRGMAGRCPRPERIALIESASTGGAMRAVDIQNSAA